MVGVRHTARGLVGCSAGVAAAVGVFFLSASFAAAAGAPPAGDDIVQPAETRAAVERSLVLLQSSARTWTTEIACFSCHHQGLGSIAVALSREVGFEVGEEAAGRELDAIHGYAGKRIERLMTVDGAGVFSRSFTLLALRAGERPRDLVTDLVSHYLASRQSVSGAWYSNEHRPPLEDSVVSATALTLRALQLYGPEARAPEMEARVARAGAWLRDVRPIDNEERVLRLFGLAWSDAPAALTARAAEELAREQRDDGGWAQLSTMESDPYATGQALVALNQIGGLPTSDPRWARGARFLVDAQHEDGSWFVETRRRIEGQRQRQSGFPYGESQFISYAASTWATMALALHTAEPGRVRALFGPPASRAGPRGGDWSALFDAALFGSAAQVRDLLRAGAPVDERGPRELTPLMAAAHDPEKIEALLAAGADPNARSVKGYTPLSFAAMTSGAQRSVEQLLAQGASAKALPDDVAGPVFCATGVGELDTARALLDAGAPFPRSDLDRALGYSACCGDVASGEFLLELGADPDALTFQKHSALMSAAISGYPDLVAVLLEAGADVDVQDPDGMTALAWAAKIDPGHTRTVELLLRAGSDPARPSANGRTPLDWAVFYGNDEHAILLREAIERAR